MQVIGHKFFVVPDSEFVRVIWIEFHLRESGVDLYICIPAWIKGEVNITAEEVLAAHKSWVDRQTKRVN
jgi:hypothetical protein